MFGDRGYNKEFACYSFILCAVMDAVFYVIACIINWIIESISNRGIDNYDDQKMDTLWWFISYILMQVFAGSVILIPVLDSLLPLQEIINFGFIFKSLLCIIGGYLMCYHAEIACYILIFDGFIYMIY